MMNRVLGESGIEASAVGLGTWAIGGWMWGGVDESNAERAIQTSIDEGVTLIDTAPAYGFGRSEEIVGRAIAGCRDRVVLATKCGLVWERQEGQFFFNSDERGLNPTGSHKVYRLLSAASIREEVEASLKRLRTDRVDLYQTHWQDATTPIGETMTELLKLKAEGKIRAIGVCNATAAQMEEYRALGPLDSDQEKFSMLDRQIEQDQLPYCRAQGIAVLAYSPLALGLLSGKIDAGRKYGEGDLRQDNPRFTPENLGKVSALFEKMRPLAVNRGLTLAQLVIAWTVAQPGLTHALVGARDPDQARENAAAGRVKLTSEELTQIDQALREHPLS
jgi:methylglyoxal reductase